MKLFTILGLAASASAHATFQQLWVNESDKEGFCARTPKSNSPLQNVNSEDMRCNVGGSVGVGGVCETKPGDVLTAEMHQHNDRKCEKEAIGGRHFGPVMVYMCAVPDATSADGNCDWVKVAEDGYAGTDESWGSEKVNRNCGKFKLKVPENLKAGDYLLRAEVLALHVAQSKGGGQFYMTCYQIKVGGSGTTPLPQGVRFPGAYKETDPGIMINIYGDQGKYGNKKYIVPGPPVWNGTSTASSGGIEKMSAKPAESAKESPKKAAKEATKDTNKDAPKETTKGASKERPKETSKDASKETPKDSSKQAPKDNSRESPKEASKQSPKADSEADSKASPKESSKPNSEEAPAEKASPKQGAKKGGSPSAWSKAGSKGGSKGNFKACQG